MYLNTKCSFYSHKADICRVFFQMICYAQLKASVEQHAASSGDLTCLFANLRKGKGKHLRSNEPLLTTSKGDLMTRERDGGTVGYPLLIVPDRATKLGFIPIKSFDLLLKHRAYIGHVSLCVHILSSQPQQVLFFSQVNHDGYSLARHEFNPSSNNNSTVSSSQRGHVHWHISQFNFSSNTGLEPNGCLVLNEIREL